jgi:hypothetical protein
MEPEKLRFTQRLPDQWGKPFLHVFILEKNFKIFFSTSREQISIKYKYKLSLHEGNSSLNKGPSFLQRGNNHKNAKIGCCHLKMFFSRTTLPE